MNRYDKRQVMKDAHRIYKNDFQRKGRSWGECLKAAWSWERDAVRVREAKAARLDAMIAAKSVKSAISDSNLHLLNGRLANVSNQLKMELWVTI